MFTLIGDKLVRTPPPNQGDVKVAANETGEKVLNSSLIDLGEGAVQDAPTPGPSQSTGDRQDDANASEVPPAAPSDQNEKVLELVAELVRTHTTSSNIPVKRLEEILAQLGIASVTPQLPPQAQPQRQPQPQLQLQLQQPQPQPQLYPSPLPQAQPQQFAHAQPQAVQGFTAHPFYFNQPHEQFRYPLSQPPSLAPPQPTVWPQQPIANPFDNPPIGIGAVNARVQPPPIDKEHIDLWLVRLESWFNNNQVRSDNQRFHILTTLLDTQLISLVYDATQSPPETGKYDFLKAAVRDALEESRHKRFQRLLHGQGLGDQRPSHRLNELKRLAQNGLTMNDNLLRHIWIAQLPSEAQAILAVSSDQTLPSLAKLADDVVEGLSSRTIAAASQREHASSEPDYIRHLRKAVENLTADVVSLKKRDRSRSNTRHPGKGHKKSDRSPSPSPAKLKNDLCWYHYKYGEDARNCQTTCSRYEEMSKN